MYEQQGRFLRQLIELTWTRRTWTRAGRALGLDPGTLRRFGRRRLPPPIHLALRFRDVLGLPLAYWVDGIPQEVRPEDVLPRSSKDLGPREWNDRPASLAAHGRLLRELIEDAGLTLEQARWRLGAGSRSGLRYVLNGEGPPNVRVAYLAWRELGFECDWWRWTVPGELRRAA